MAYRVCISEGFLRPLPPLIRGRIRSELQIVAEMAERLPSNSLNRGTGAEAMPVRPLPHGYWISYRQDDRARTVRLMVVAQPKAAASAH